MTNKQTLEAQIELEVVLNMNLKSKEKRSYWEGYAFENRRKFIGALAKEYKELTGHYYKDGKYRGE